MLSIYSFHTIDSLSIYICQTNCPPKDKRTNSTHTIECAHAQNFFSLYWIPLICILFILRNSIENKMIMEIIGNCRKKCAACKSFFYSPSLLLSLSFSSIHLFAFYFLFSFYYYFEAVDQSNCAKMWKLIRYNLCLYPNQFLQRIFTFDTGTFTLYVKKRIQMKQKINK